MESTLRLDRIRALLDVYEEGSGAKNSWEKTNGLRVGPLRGDATLPEGWREGENIVTTSDTVAGLSVCRSEG